MKNNIYKNTTRVLAVGFSLLFLAQCTPPPNQNKHQEKEHQEKEELQEVHLSQHKIEYLNIKIDTIPFKMVAEKVRANGHLEVPPQHEATITAIIGANLTNINVIEGEHVEKGGVLGYIAHPHLIQLQTKFMTQFHQLNYLEKEYLRQKTLYQQNIGAKKSFQKIKADYSVAKAQWRGLRIQLEQLNLDVQKIEDGKIYKKVPIISPIEGYIEEVLVQIGQYVNPSDELFSVINNDHLHADLMVYETDFAKIKKGQKVIIHISSLPDYRGEATIKTVGKTFEEKPRALHIHAELATKEDFMIPGLYITGNITVDTHPSMALPTSAIIEEANNSYIFMAELTVEEGEKEWHFTPIKIQKGKENKGWVAITLPKDFPKEAKVVWNKAYKIISEMKKSSTSHEH